jgi:hypothetical protein
MPDRSPAPARLPRALAPALLLLALAGCEAGEGAGAAARASVGVNSAPGAEGEALPPPTAIDTPRVAQRSDDFEAQPRLEALRARTPADMGFRPGSTPWRPAELDVPPRFTEARLADAPSPMSLVRGMGDALDWGAETGEGLWEQTVRIRHDDEDRATVTVLHWGYLDDSVAGGDLRLRLRRVDGGWVLEGAEERFHCRRGVTDDGLCT